MVVKNLGMLTRRIRICHQDSPACQQRCDFIQFVFPTCSSVCLHACMAQAPSRHCQTAPCAACWNESQGVSLQRLWKLHPGCAKSPELCARPKHHGGSCNTVSVSSPRGTHLGHCSKAGLWLLLKQCLSFPFLSFF